MDFDQFMGDVQHRARMATTGEAVRATYATLRTMGERLYGDEAENLAAQLPPEIGIYLRAAGEQEAFPLDKFFERAANYEEVDLPESVHHTRAVVATLQEAVTAGEMSDVRAQLPDEYAPLFEAGSEGDLETS
jgi:uncharacterized protein (DUF2267 family)